MKTIRVAAVQIPNKLGLLEQQLEIMQHWIDQAALAGADLVFFPECSLTGYTFKNPAQYAIQVESPSACALEEHARNKGLALGYGLIEGSQQGGAPFISYVVLDPQGGRLLYRKTHLGATEAAFEAGNSLPVADIAGVCVGVQQCWESHIPDIATTLRSQGAEVVLTPYAMGAHGPGRIDSWNRYLAARANDNGMFVVACNALFPEAENERCGGGIAAWGPDGVLLGGYGQPEAHMEVFVLEGMLPRENAGGGMRSISYFDRRRPELYQL